MKKHTVQLTILGICMLLTAACKKSEMRTYKDDQPALYMGMSSYAYSFVDDLTAATKTIYLPVKLSGQLQDYDRSFKMEVVTGTGTTADAALYEVKEGVLPKNAVDGRIAIVLKRNTLVDTSLVDLTLRLLPSADLDTMLNTQTKVTWTAKIIKPVNWDRWLRYYLGTGFSTAWFKFIIQHTGRTSFPYDGTLSRTDPVTWWMTAGEIQGYGLQVKEALLEYNLMNPNNPFIHDDGPSKGLPVVLP